MPKTIEYTTDEELRNVLHGLELLHGECMDMMNRVRAYDLGGVHHKNYFISKQTEVSKQIQGVRQLLANG